MFGFGWEGESGNTSLDPKSFRLIAMQKSVPVVDSNQVPLMPTTSTRAAKWIKNGKATPFWKKGIFCVRLNVEPSARNYQPVACGIDPGSRMEGYTISSANHQYLFNSFEWSRLWSRLSYRYRRAGWRIAFNWRTTRSQSTPITHC